MSDSDGDQVKLQVELRPIGTPFSNSFTHEGSFVASGSLVTVAITGLVPGTGYHWQARTIDAGAITSDWTVFGANLETDPDLAILASGNTAPTAPTSPAQLRADGATTIGAGATTIESTVVIRGTITDPDSNPVRLLLELRPQASPLTGTPTHRGDFAASGSAVTMVVTGLTAGGWHWQIATEDSKGGVSTFTTPGGAPDFTVNTAGNATPTVSLPGQFEPPSTALAVGGSSQGTQVVFKATLTDADGSSRLEIEVRPIGTMFSNTASGVTGFIASATEGSISIDGLAGDYHWQYRVVDASGAASAWTSFGGNTEAETDFTMAAAAPPVLISTVNKKKLCGASEGGSPLAIASMIVIVGLLAMRRWR